MFITLWWKCMILMKSKQHTLHNKLSQQMFTCGQSNWSNVNLSAPDSLLPSNTNHLNVNARVPPEYLLLTLQANEMLPKNLRQYLWIKLSA